MSIGLFFVIFFVLLLAAVVWILRPPNSRPLMPTDSEHWQQHDDDLIADPAYSHVPGNVWHDDA